MIENKQCYTLVIIKPQFIGICIMSQFWHSNSTLSHLTILLCTHYKMSSEFFQQKYILQHTQCTKSSIMYICMW